MEAGLQELGISAESSFPFHQDMRRDSAELVANFGGRDEDFPGCSESTRGRLAAYLNDVLQVLATVDSL